jgi:hypothetical protein
MADHPRRDGSQPEVLADNDRELGNHVVRGESFLFHALTLSFCKT